MSETTETSLDRAFDILDGERTEGVWRVLATYQVARMGRDGDEYVATVEVHDMGPKAPGGQRYACMARRENGKGALSNRSDSIDTAMIMLAATLSELD